MCTILRIELISTRSPYSIVRSTAYLLAWSISNIKPERHSQPQKVFVGLEFAMKLIFFSSNR